jgi:hypothetical protein
MLETSTLAIVGNRNQALNKVIGGWYFSGIFNAASGLPMTVAESNQAWGGGDTLGLVFIRGNTDQSPRF